MSKKISIIIPNWNGSKILKQCLKSLIDQQNEIEEVIIVDNGSTDDTYEWVNDHSVVKFYRLDKNYGITIAVNKGIKLAKSSYIMILNNDTVLEKECISYLIKQIESDNNVFSVASKMIQYHNNKYIDDAGDEYSLLGQAVQRGNGEVITHYTKSEQIFSACSGAALYRKELLEKIGLFDEEFFAYLDDVEIGYRARVNGYKNVYCPQAIVYHIGSATSKKQASTFTIHLINRNNVYMLYKNMPILQLIINIPFLSIGYLLKLIYYRTDKVKAEAFKQAVREGIANHKDIKKESFQFKNIWNYFKIQMWLIRGTYYFFKSQLTR